MGRKKREDRNDWTWSLPVVGEVLSQIARARDEEEALQIQNRINKSKPTKTMLKHSSSDRFSRAKMAAHFLVLNEAESRKKR